MKNAQGSLSHPLLAQHRGTIAHAVQIFTRSISLGMNACLAHSILTVVADGRRPGQMLGFGERLNVQVVNFVQRVSF